MSNKNVRVKFRVLVIAEEIKDKSDSDLRPGRTGTQRKQQIDIPVVEVPFTEFAQRISDVENLLRYGNVLAEALPPSAVADDPSDVDHNSATLNGTVESQEVATTVTFQYGTTEALGSNVTADESPVNDADKVAVTAAISGLTASTKYYYRVKCVSATKTTYSLIRSFTTDSTPA